ncbi:helix-turn-helix transcriptional regulator [Geobacillus stearothermophilus]|uniref:helix-turn-helix transcriptional regulator n=1 Tax=Geobacillus proteiniphilus TaxID=860353 RepID=UPI000938B29E|nr:helix-turn-helix transcriptional regulator [Geobacillus proteiniphilus]WJQ07673.1 helix-turn-helix transcriptional regulator [Geobacillus stearothermophilus]WJQ11148.1 helix-turn-helix transcriptional regulator [Geobacillus stearothermophilus]
MSQTGYKCRLKVILAEEGIKHGEFARRINISPGTLSAIVNDKQLPSFDVAYAICTELKRPVEEIWVKKDVTLSESE